MRGKADIDGPTKALTWAVELENSVVKNPSLSPAFNSREDLPRVVPVIAGVAGDYASRSPELWRPIFEAYCSAGLMALTLTYLNAGWDVWGRVTYSKSAFPVMVRNSFTALYEVLKQPAAFTADEAIITSSHGKDTEGGRLYDDVLMRLVPKADVNGRDLLARGSVRYSSTSIGAMERVSILNVPFAIIEFREWPKTSLHPQL